jgi:molecular chaperone DnaJ
MGDPFGGMGLGDIMDAFFGGGGGGGRSRGPRSRVRQGDDALIPIELTLEECASGVAKDLAVDTATLCSVCQGSGCNPGTTPMTCDTCKGAGEIQQVQRSLLGQVVTSRPCPVCRGYGEVIPDPCRQCNGDGRVRARRTVRANIPAGVGDGIRVRLAGQGEVGPGGGAPGDLYVEVQELQHERFTRDGIDLHCTVHVPMTAAALGTSMALHTLQSVEDLDIQPGTQSGTVITMRGQGMPRLRGSGVGNLHIHVEVVTPTKVDARQAEVLRELATLRGEEQPELAARAHGGFFSRLRDSFAGR